MGMLGLLLAFTFGMSNDRYNKRRDLIIEEANDIGTAILRADLYPTVRGSCSGKILNCTWRRVLVITPSDRISMPSSGITWKPTA
jgi:hypothetical protein